MQHNGCRGSELTPMGRCVAAHVSRVHLVLAAIFFAGYGAHRSRILVTVMVHFWSLGLPGRRLCWALYLQTWRPATHAPRLCAVKKYSTNLQGIMPRCAQTCCTSCTPMCTLFAVCLHALQKYQRSIMLFVEFSVHTRLLYYFACLAVHRHTLSVPFRVTQDALHNT